MDAGFPFRSEVQDSSAGAGASVGQILGEIGRIEGKITNQLGEQTVEFKRIQGEFNRLRTDVMEKLAEFSTVVSALSSRPCSSQSGPSATKSTESRKRHIPEAKSIEHLFVLCEKERYQPPLVKYLMMLSLFCFVYEYPQLNSWIPPGMKTAMSSIRPKLGDVSGFSVMYFSKTRDDKGTKFSGRIGTLWSWLISSTIVAIVLASRTNDFEKNRKDAPPWINSFGGLASALSRVEPVVECLERHNVVPLAKERSKRHKKGDAQVSDALSKDPVRGEREQAIDTLRSLVLGLLTDGRLKSRQVIFSKFLFAIEAMKEFESIGQARANGFYIELTAPSAREELDLPGVIAGTAWEIPKTRVESPNDATTVSANVKLFKEHLLDKFDCMNGLLRFRKSVIRTSDAINDAETHPEVLDPKLEMDFTEPFNLHRIAMGILVDMFGLQDFHSVLSCSALSLRVIHITALALRGLILRAIGEAMLPIEETALGNVTYTVLDKSDVDDIATVAMGTRAETGTKRKDSAILMKLRKSRRELAWDEYKAEKEKRRAEAVVPDVAEINTSSNVDETPSAAHGVIDMSWMDGMS